MSVAGSCDVALLNACVPYTYGTMSTAKSGYSVIRKSTSSLGHSADVIAQHSLCIRNSLILPCSLTLVKAISKVSLPGIKLFL